MIFAFIKKMYVNKMRRKVSVPPIQIFLWLYIPFKNKASYIIIN